MNREIVYDGASGSVKWSIDNKGLMLFEPVNGNKGTLAEPKMGEYHFVREWNDYCELIKKVVAIGKIYLPKNSSWLFSYYTMLTNIDVSHFDTHKVTNMEAMFQGCFSLTSLDLSSFNTSNVNSMASMFYNCHSLTSINVSNFDTSNVDDMTSMFEGCRSLISLDISHFDTSSLVDMKSMFYGCSQLTSIYAPSFNTNNIVNMSRAFQGCISLVDLDLTGVKSLVEKITYCILDGCDSLSNLMLSEDVERATNNLILPAMIVEYAYVGPINCLDKELASLLIRFIEKITDTDFSEEKRQILKHTEEWLSEYNDIEDSIDGISFWKVSNRPIKKIQGILRILREHRVTKKDLRSIEFKSLLKKGVMSDINAYLSGVPLEDILA